MPLVVPPPHSTPCKLPCCTHAHMAACTRLQPHLLHPSCPAFEACSRAHATAHPRDCAPVYLHVHLHQGPLAFTLARQHALTPSLLPTPMAASPVACSARWKRYSCRLNACFCAPPTHQAMPPPTRRLRSAAAAQWLKWLSSRRAATRASRLARPRELDHRPGCTYSSDSHTSRACKRR